MSEHLTETQLHELCDGSLTESECLTWRHHVDACPSCTDRLTRLERLLASAAAVPAEIAPPEDLWPAIRSRIESAGIGAISGPATESAAARSWWTGRAAALGAAAALILVTATITALLVGPGPPAERPERAVVAPANAPPNVAMLIADYEELTGRLAQELARQRNTLPTDALTKIENNLRVIDEALHEVQLALEREPDDDALLQLLANAYRQKVSVLEHATESVS